MRIGIEVEYWTVDDTGALTPATDVAAQVDCAETEFVEPLLEIKTPPCNSITSTLETLITRVETARRAAADRNLHLLPLGVPVTDDDVEIRDEADPRIAIQRAAVGADFEHARYCAGTHVHFEQVDPLTQLRVLTAIDPAFALVNTTPYYRGRRVAACARPRVYRRRCYGSLPDHGQLWRYPGSIEEWRCMQAQRFETFVAAAESAGVESEDIFAHFSPDDAVWSPVRLREDVGTVEWRAPDAAPLSDVCRLLRDVTNIVERAVDTGVRLAADGPEATGVQLPAYERLTARVDAAIDHGLADDRVRTYLETLGFDVDAYRPYGVRIDGDDRVDPAMAERIHRRAVDRLDRDIRILSEAGTAAVATPNRPTARSD